MSVSSKESRGDPKSPTNNVQVRKSSRVVQGRKSNFSNGSNFSGSPLLNSGSLNSPSGIGGVSVAAPASVKSNDSGSGGSRGSKGGGAKRRSHVSKNLKLNVSKALMEMEANHGKANVDEAGLAVGIGVYDITGTCVDIGFQGYSKFNRLAVGLHMRLFARAFIFANGRDRVCLVSCEVTSVQVDVREEVLRLLQEHFGGEEMCPYNEANLMISATNTYSSCGGTSHYLFDQMSSGGYVAENFAALTEGIVHAIVRAHNSMIVGVSLHYGEEKVASASVNRTPSAYDLNPAEERKQYDSKVDEYMNVLRIADSKKDDIAVLAFFPVAGASYTSSHKLVSGDNKGIASYLFERKVNGARYLPGTKGFLAAFFQTNCGDATPRVRGAQCSELPHSKCTPEKHVCEFLGAAETEEMSAFMSGRNQYKTALNLFLSGCEREIKPTVVAHSHMYCDLAHLVVDKKYTSTGKEETLTEPCLGQKYAEGNSDGRGRWPLEKTYMNLKTYPIPAMLWSQVEPTPEEVKELQAPKEVIIDIERHQNPGRYIPEVFPLQIFQIGKLFLVGVPAELSTMAGRRLRETLMTSFPPLENKEDEPIILIVGLANGYMHHVTTYEEYQAQEFEGASTLFGPHTLAGLQQEYSRMYRALLSGQADRIKPGKPPADVSEIDFHDTRVVLDDEVPMDGFGSVIEHPSANYEPGEVVTVKFWGANPRNDLRLGDTYCLVERHDLDSKSWVTVATDANFETRFLWERNDKNQSIVTIEWEVPNESMEGMYRIKYFGCRTKKNGEKFNFTGSSRSFTVGGAKAGCIIL